MKKMQNKKGFTLMEMLIVVAIIAILVAIAIPTFSSALDKANIAADKANIRAAYAECLIDHIMGVEAFPASAPAELTALLKGDGTLTWTYEATTGIIDISYEGMDIDNDEVPKFEAN